MCEFWLDRLVTGVTGVRLPNLKNFRTRILSRFENFGIGAESESEKVTPATSGVHHRWPWMRSAGGDSRRILRFSLGSGPGAKIF